jgi:ABC-type phosphate transport system permease subunit
MNVGTDILYSVVILVVIPIIVFIAAYIEENHHK